MRRFASHFALCCVLFLPALARAQFAEEETVKESIQVLREVMQIPAKGIPESLLAKAQGLVIVPGMFKGGFVIGVKHGDGIVLTREANGSWRSPVFAEVTGGSLGLQAGVQRTDVILVILNKTSVESIMRGKFTIGADASVAAGPVGRDAAAATDGQLKAEILSYSRSRGLFAGVSLDGAAIRIDDRATKAFYERRADQPAYPVSAAKLLEQVTAYSNPGKGVAGIVPSGDERETVRQQLAAASQGLLQTLDPQWQQFLTVPLGAGAAGSDAMRQSQARYETIAADPRYRALSDRREFQDVVRLLRRYNSFASTPSLPPPPK